MDTTSNHAEDNDREPSRAAGSGANTSCRESRTRVDVAYGVADLLLAAAYVAIFFWLVPSRSLAFSVFAGLFSGVMAAGGIGMLLAGRWGRRLASVSAVLMLLACAALLVLLLASVAYLHGIYGGVGQAAVVIALVAAALTVELVGLLPALQLAHLRRCRQQRD